MTEGHSAGSCRVRRRSAAQRPSAATAALCTCRKAERTSRCARRGSRAAASNTCWHKRSTRPSFAHAVHVCCRLHHCKSPAAAVGRLNDVASFTGRKGLENGARAPPPPSHLERDDEVGVQPALVRAHLLPQDGHVGQRLALRAAHDTWGQGTEASGCCSIGAWTPWPHRRSAAGVVVPRIDAISTSPLTHTAGEGVERLCCACPPPSRTACV